MSIFTQMKPILKNLIKQDVCFKVRSRQSKHINIRVSPSSGLIYRRQESLTIKVMVEPVNDETCLDNIASGKEKKEVGCLKNLGITLHLFQI